MNKTKYNFFEQILIAATKPMEYFRITKTSGGRLTGFVFLFVLVTSLFLIVPISFTLLGPDGVTSYIKNNIPAFQLSNGELHTEERVEEDDGMSYILIDTDVEQYTRNDISYLYTQVFLVSKTNMIMYQAGTIQEFKFSDFGNITLDNSIIDKMMPIVYFTIILMLIFYYLILVGAYFLTALLYSLVGLIVSLATNASVKYARIFKTAIYCKVTSSILYSLYFVLTITTPLNIPWYMSTGIIILINCAYVVYGTLSHNTEAAHQDTALNAPPENHLI